MVKFFDMKLANKDIDISKIISGVINSYEFSLGEFVNDFEKKYSEYLDIKYCVGVGNGTDGLELALISLDVKPGDTVLTVANAGFYASTAINSIGAIPYFIDVSDDNLLIDLEALHNLLEKKLFSAVVITHLYGQAVNMKKVKEMIKEFNIKIVEDCAHAHGGLFDNQKLGTFGDVGVFSFYPTKNLGAIGDGGAVVTNNENIFEKLISLRQYGWTEKYYVKNIYGRNSRLDAIQAAVLSAKLEYLDKWNTNRIEIAKQYLQGLKDTPLNLNENLSNNPPHIFPLRSKDRNKLIFHLDNSGIQTGIHYPVPDHLQEVFNLQNIKLKITEKSSKEIISIPIYPNMPINDINYVIKSIKEFYLQYS